MTPGTSSCEECNVVVSSENDEFSTCTGGFADSHWKSGKIEKRKIVRKIIFEITKIIYYEIRPKFLAALQTSSKD